MRISRGIAFAGILMVLAAAAAAPADHKQNDLLQKVVAFCRDHNGEQVGRGECSDLAGAALREAGAKRRGKDDPNEGDYTWGKLVLVVTGDEHKPTFEHGTPAQLRPGDVIQFRDAKFVHHDGRRWSSQSYGHHTAVVASTEGTTVHLFQQNVGGKRVVMPGTFRLDELKTGWLRFYQPVPREDSETAPD